MIKCRPKQKIKNKKKKEEEEEEEENFALEEKI